MNNYQNLDNFNPQQNQHQQHPFNYDNNKSFSSSSSDEENSKPFQVNKSTRKGFIRKVYMILSFQLSITFLFVLAIFLSDDFFNFTRQHVWITYVCMGVYIICVYALACYTSVARKVPINYILMLLLTLAMSYMVATIASVYERDTVLVAAGLTAAMVVSLTIYAIFTKTDITNCGGVLVVCTTVLFVGGIIGIFWRNKWFHLIMSILGVIVFGIYLIYDTQLIIGDKNRKLSYDDYIMGAVMLYIDIIQIFLYILQILGSVQNNQFFIKIFLFLNFSIIKMNYFTLNNQLEVSDTSKGLLNHKNSITTTLYTYYNFLPLALLNQLKKITNIYFLGIAIIAVLPGINAINTQAIFLPVAYVIIFAMLFDLWEDFKRFRSDQKTNRHIIYQIKNCKKHKSTSKKIKIGDVIFLDQNDEVQADILLLTFMSPNNFCYIETTSLDGEKNLKPKVSLMSKDLSGIFLESKFEKNVIFENLKINYRDNTEDLNQFDGSLELSLNINGRIENKKIRIDDTNFIPRSSNIRNTQQVLGLVVFVGSNTKVMKNTQKRIFKYSKLEQKMHKIIVVILVLLFLLLIFVSVFYIIMNRQNRYSEIVLYQDFNEGWQFVRVILGYLVLMNTVLPISLIITFQLIKVYQNQKLKYSNWFDNQKTNNKILPNSNNLNDQLGQVEYVLSDKTGTLTQNKMIARYFQIWNCQKFLESTEENNNIENQELSMTILQSDDEIKNKNVRSERLLSLNPEKGKFTPIELKSKDNKKQLTISNKDEFIKIYLTLINCCNECFPTTSETIYQTQNIEFEGSSPDEIALLRGSRDNFNFYLKGHTTNSILIYDNGNTLEYEKIFVFKFDSERKMMSVLVKYKGNYFLFVKGADNTVAEKSINGSSNDLPSYFTECIDFYLETGLRVMFVAMRLLSEEEVFQFQSDIDEVEKNPLSTKNEIYQTKKKIEENLFIFGATAIEDLLQEQLKETIDILKIGGIKIWMITGDKQDTAKNIAYSAGLFTQNVQPVILNQQKLEQIEKNSQKKIQTNSLQLIPDFIFRWRRNQQEKLKIQFDEKVPHDGVIDPQQSLKIRRMSTRIIEEKMNLLIDGRILSKILSSKCKRHITEYLMSFECVVFSRTNPKQKVQILRLLKDKKIKTLAIGDGANDVNMIQESDVGIGIMGEEGQQAVNASDYAIPQFQYLKNLMFHFGRISYYQNSLFILTFIYKNFIMTFMQLFFAFSTYFTIKNFYQDWYLSFYNLFFAGFLVPFTAIVNQDLPRSQYYKGNDLIVESYMYYQGQRALLFNVKKFLFWCFSSFIESGMIYFFIQKFSRKHFYYQNCLDHNIFSFTVFFSLFIHHNVKIIFITWEYHFLNILGLMLNISSVLIYMYSTDVSTSLGYYKNVQKTIHTSIFWIYQLFILLTLLWLNLLFFGLKRYFFEGTKDVIRNNEDLKGKKLQKFLEKERNNLNKKSFKNFINNQFFILIFNINNVKVCQNSSALKSQK